MMMHGLRIFKSHEQHSSTYGSQNSHIRHWLQSTMDNQPGDCIESYFHVTIGDLVGTYRLTNTLITAKVRQSTRFWKELSHDKHLLLSSSISL